MLNKIFFLGYEVKKSSYTKSRDVKRGRFKVNTGEFSVYTAEESKNGRRPIKITLEPRLNGFEVKDDDSVDDNSPSFEIKIEMDVFFEYKGEEEISDKLMNESEWFFQNFCFVAMKLAFENQLKDTDMSDIKLPFKRKEI
ncbi:hypothetical protein ACONW8_003583 [Yersinia enterocolitica]|nr:hypothetical protein [Yersinia enterocolitica]